MTTNAFRDGLSISPIAAGPKTIGSVADAIVSTMDTTFFATELCAAATAEVIGLGNSIVRWSGSLVVGVLWTGKLASTASLAACDAGAEGVLAVTETP